MHAYSRLHLADPALLRAADLHRAAETTAVAALLADLAEIDRRRLYLAAGYDSMFSYCTQHLRLTEDAACSRIDAARAARDFPILFPALADRRLHLSAVLLLAPHLTAENAGELVALAANRSKAEIKQRLAQKFPPADLWTSAGAFAAPMTAMSSVLERMEFEPNSTTAPTARAGTGSNEPTASTGSRSSALPW